MKKFLDEDFLLQNKTAEILYKNYAKDAPIFDFHCHLSPKEIYEDKKFRSLTEVWLSGDHYKWRLMREAGIDESYISGDKPDYEKFLKYAGILPYAIGNPTYHWTHLELKRFFGIDTVLSPETAYEIYSAANKKLETLTARKMIEKANVKEIFTTDDPTDDLSYHIALKKEGSFGTNVSPTFRPDKAINIEHESFVPWLIKLEAISDMKIKTLDNLTDALTQRIDFFDKNGCVCSDHALDSVLYEDAEKSEISVIFDKALKKEKLTLSELSKYKGYMLMFLGKEYARRNWAQQYHIGALRNNSTRNMTALGADTGFDAIGDAPFASSLSRLLDKLDSSGELPKTILYCLNPRDNEVLAAIKNCFQDKGTFSKIQFGSAWWFNDQKDGILRQLEALSQCGLLSKFVGMLTDSRSFLSYSRHEYFRRILCNKLGGLIENGEYPADIEFVGSIVQDICYNNAKNYFKK